MSAGRLSAMKPRTSSRNASSSAVMRRSMGRLPVRSRFFIMTRPRRPYQSPATFFLVTRVHAGRCFATKSNPGAEGGIMAELPGKDLAQELIAESQAESRTTPIEDVVAAARNPGLDRDAANRLVGRLWTLERMFYYIYGGWGQGLEMNDYPPSVKYLFSKQIVDESTHEMLYMDALLRQGCV